MPNKLKEGDFVIRFIGDVSETGKVVHIYGDGYLMVETSDFGELCIWSEKFCSAYPETVYEPIPNTVKARLLAPVILIPLFSFVAAITNWISKL